VAELQEAVDSRQRLEAQKTENLGVQKVRLTPTQLLSDIVHRLTSRQEFSKLKEDETIYKLIGPVLLKQEKAEAESTVNGRLDFIGKEM
jgi:prefoldin beta subunit